MIRPCSLVIVWGCRFILFAVPAAVLYCLFNQDAFVAFTRSSLRLPIQWHTVETSQWYALWLLTALYLAVGLAGLYFLSRAFAGFARGEYFNPANSRNLRRFSALLFAQALAKPVLFALSSVLLSLNHPVGERMLSVMVGSDELALIGIALIFWVTSQLLVEGSRLESENRMFV